MAKSDTDRILHELALVREDIGRLGGNRLDIFIHFPSATPGGSLERIEANLQTLISKETQQMALGQDILDKVAAHGTTIDSIKALLDAWVSDNSITAEQRDAIFAAFDANSGKLSQIETALQPATT